MIEQIIVMWQRQLKLYIRSKYRVLGSLVQPLLFLMAFGFGLGPVFEQAGQGNYIQYLLPGIVAMTVLFSSVMNGISLIWDKNFGFLKETLVAPVPRVVLLLGRCLGGATIGMIQGLFLLIISFSMGYRVENWALFPSGLAAMFLIALMFTLLGTSIASKIDNMHAFPVIINFLIMPMFFLSGALFPISNFPRPIEIIALSNPMTYCVDLLQFTLGEGAGFSLVLDISVLLSGLVILSIIGTYLFNRLEA